MGINRTGTATRVARAAVIFIYSSAWQQLLIVCFLTVYYCKFIQFDQFKNVSLLFRVWPDSLFTAHSFRSAPIEMYGFPKKPFPPKISPNRMTVSHTIDIRSCFPFLYSESDVCDSIDEDSVEHAKLSLLILTLTRPIPMIFEDAADGGRWAGTTDKGGLNLISWHICVNNNERAAEVWTMSMLTIQFFFCEKYELDLCVVGRDVWQFWGRTVAQEGLIGGGWELGERDIELILHASCEIYNWINLCEGRSIIWGSIF